MTLQDEIRLLLQAPMMNTHDVRTQLRLDHDEALQVARDMVDADDGDARRMLLRRLRPSLLIHLQAVRLEVYPSLRNTRGARRAGGMVDERLADHESLETTLAWLARSRKTESVEWASRAQSLLTVLRRHVDVEQEDVFALLGEHFDDAALARMAQGYLAEKAQLSASDVKLANMQFLRAAGSKPRASSGRARRGGGVSSEDFATGKHQLQV